FLHPQKKMFVQLGQAHLYQYSQLTDSQNASLKLIFPPQPLNLPEVCNRYNHCSFLLAFPQFGKVCFDFPPISHPRLLRSYHSRSRLLSIRLCYVKRGSITLFFLLRENRSKLLRAISLFQSFVFMIFKIDYMSDYQPDSTYIHSRAMPMKKNMNEY